MRTSGLVRLRCSKSHAGVAQLAERPSCKRQVSGSTPLTGSTTSAVHLCGGQGQSHSHSGGQAVLDDHCPGRWPVACHPVVATWAEEAIWLSAGAGEQKFANLRSNPHVVLTTGCNRWDQGLDVVVEGDAVRVTDDAVLSRVAGGVRRQVGRAVAVHCSRWLFPRPGRQ